MSSNFTVRLLDDERTRKKQGRSAWLLERDGTTQGQIVHQHSAERRELLARGAWFTVCVGNIVAHVHSRDFGDALKRAAELLAQPKPTKRTKGARR